MADISVQELIAWCNRLITQQEVLAEHYPNNAPTHKAVANYYRATAEALQELQTIREKWAHIEEHRLVEQLNIPTGLAVKFADFMDAIKPLEQIKGKGE